MGYGVKKMPNPSKPNVGKLKRSFGGDRIECDNTDICVLSSFNVLNRPGIAGGPNS
jgi:hypothetical protein